jgi:hypothetical protein
MRWRGPLSCLAACGLFVTTLALVQAPACPLYPDPEQPAARGRHAEPLQAYSGWIVREDGYYVLINTNSRLTYRLDNQRKAKRFAGRDVIVIGTLDTVRNVIHVSEIRPNKSS